MTSTWLIPLSILATSFFGSIHCAGMCGPIATLMAERKSLLSYHLGRFISYVSLGLIAGSAGEFFLKSDFTVLRWMAAGSLGGILLFMGIAKIFPNAVPAFIRNYSPVHKVFFKLQRLRGVRANHSGWITGLLTALLPCGWLYTYVLAAAATQSTVAGGLTLCLFWLGGLPALSAFPFMIRETIRKTGAGQQKIAGLVLIASSLYSLISFMFLH